MADGKTTDTVDPGDWQAVPEEAPQPAPSTQTQTQKPTTDPGDWQPVTPVPFSVQPQTPRPSKEAVQQLQRTGQDPAQDVGKPLYGTLPTIGGTAGGILGTILGGPGGGVLGGTAGAGLGSTAEQWIEGKPISGQEAAEQAIWQGAAPELFGFGTGRAIAKVFSRFRPARLVQSALGAVGPEADKATQAVLKQGIKLNPATAAAQTQTRIEQLGNQIDNLIAASPADIPAKQYLSKFETSLDALRNKWGKDPIDGQKFVDQIDAFEKNFLVRHGNVKPIVKQGLVMEPTGVLDRSGHPTFRQRVTTETILPKDMDVADLRANAGPLSTVDAQAIKKQAWETTNTLKGSAFDPLSHPGMQAEAREQIAAGLAQDLEKIYPQLKTLNPELGETIALRKELGNFVKQDTQRNIHKFLPFFVGPITGTAFGLAAHGVTPGVLAGGAATLGEEMLRRALTSPAVKSRLAIALYRAGQRPLGKAAMFAAKQVPAATYRGASWAASPHTYRINPQQTQKSLQQAFPMQAKGGLVKKAKGGAIEDKRHPEVERLMRERMPMIGIHVILGIPKP